MNEFCNSAQYVCPNCFAQKNVNDVFFRRNVKRDDADLCQMRLYTRLHENARAFQGYRLARWQTYPRDMRFLYGEIVAGLIDYNGDRLETRVCPVCHYPLPPLNQPVVTLFPWDKYGLACDRANAFFHAMSAAPVRWTTTQSKGLPVNIALTYTQLVVSGATLQFPSGLAQCDPGRVQSLQQDYAHRANAAMIWLTPQGCEEYDPKHPVLRTDIEASQTLANYMRETIGGEFRSWRPTVLFLEVGQRLSRDQRQFETFLMAEHRNLMNGIYARFPINLILPWRADNPVMMANAAQWLLTKELAADNAEETEDSSAPVE